MRGNRVREHQCGSASLSRLPNPATSEDARSLADALEWISILLMFGNVLLASIIECRVISHVQVGDEDYRVRLLKQQKEELKKAAELTDEWLAKANAKAKAKEQAKERAAGGGQATTVNPLQDDASDDESGKKQGGKKKSGKKKG
eukprot:COSAG04_NODE_1724_length_5798_cov_19.377610_5_plen_145_part_00